MDLSSICKDTSDYVDMWSDSNSNGVYYDLKASGDNRPKYVADAINNFPAIDFTGANVGLVSEHKYLKGPNEPFTWIMAIQGKDSGGGGSRPPHKNIFTTSDNNWAGLNINRDDLYPVAASNRGVHIWAAQYHNNVNGPELTKDELTILSVKYDGTEVSVRWGKDKTETKNATQMEWRRGQPGYVAMGLALQNEHHDYSGYIGEVLVYDVALESSVLENMIDVMTTKWTTGKTWKRSGNYVYYKKYSTIPE